MARLGSGELEAAVMDVLWNRGGWLTPGEVHEVLSVDGTPVYTSVMTILVRLWTKGRLERWRDGRAFVDRPLQTREEYVAAKMRAELLRARDRRATLNCFVKTMSPADRTQLRRILSGNRKIA